MKSQNEKVLKNVIKEIKFNKFNKQRQLYFGTLVLALHCGDHGQRCGEKGKTRTSFKKLFSNIATTWRLKNKTKQQQQQQLRITINFHKKRCLILSSITKNIH